MTIFVNLILIELFELLYTFSVFDRECLQIELKEETFASKSIIG